MKWLGKLLLFFFGIFLILLGGVFYAFRIEPYRLEVKKYRIKEGETVVVQLSDLHVKEDFTSEDLEKVVKSVNVQEPDIVVFTGDLYDNYALYREDENIIEKLGKIQAKTAKIAIWGNRDYGGGASRHYERIMSEAGFTVLSNENVRVSCKNGKTVLFTGLDDSMQGNPQIPGDTEEQTADCRILLTHEPDIAENFCNSDYDLILSGHSHGGQVHLPFFPELNEMAVSMTEMADRYNRGFYTLNESTGLKLYVNTGIGTTHISARFGVVPEIAVFYL